MTEQPTTTDVLMKLEDSPERMSALQDLFEYQREGLSDKELVETVRFLTDDLVDGDKHFKTILERLGISLEQ